MGTTSVVVRMTIACAVVLSVIGIAAPAAEEPEFTLEAPLPPLLLLLWVSGRDQPPSTPDASLVEVPVAVPLTEPFLDGVQP